MTFRKVRSAQQAEVARLVQTRIGSPKHSGRSASCWTTPTHAAPRLPFLQRRITNPLSDQTPAPGLALHPHQHPHRHPAPADHQSGRHARRLPRGAESVDNRSAWSEPVKIPMRGPSAAGETAPLCVTFNGRWIAPYSPYNTFDPSMIVDRNQVAAAVSDDFGRCWTDVCVLRFDDADSSAAKAWIIETDRNKLGATSWHLNQKNGSDYPNTYAVSTDNGKTWSKTRHTGTMGQTTALVELPGGKVVLFQRCFLGGLRLDALK